jgi:hypothetical protein
MTSAIPTVTALALLVFNVQPQQAPQAPTVQPQQAAQAPAAPAHKTRVLTGCLRPGDAAETYRLADVIPPPDANEPGGQSVGTSGQKVDFDVTADNGLDRSGPPIDLKPHVGQQVEVVVRPVETAVERQSNSAAPSEAKPIERKPERVIVTAIKSLGTSCASPAQRAR